MSSAQCFGQSCVSCATKTYELKGTQTESDSEEFETMETFEENEGVSALADKPIKIEKRVTVEENAQTLPCTASIQIPSANSRVFYFPTQAILTARQSYPAFVTHPPCPQLRSMQGLSHKRRTIEALAEGALMNAEEPLLFEKTIANAITEITVYDDNEKVEVSRNVLKKEGALNTEQLQNTVGLQKDAENFPKIGSCYSLQQERNSSTETERVSDFVTHSAAATSNTSPAANNCTDTGTATRTTQASSKTASQVNAKLIRIDSKSVNIAPTSCSSPNQKPPLALELVKSFPNKNFNKILPATPNTCISSNICAIPCTPARPEASKMVCTPNSAVRAIGDSTAKPVYVPKEIKIGSTELELDECVNVKDICDKELTKWTSEDVAKFVRATDCSEYADTFIDQEIDGKALTLLNQDLLIQWMNLKLGPAMKLYSHILNLKHALHKQPQL